MSKVKKLMPALRFPEFVKPWETITISDICDVFRGGPFSKADMDENGIEPCIHYGELFTKYNEVISVIYSKTNKKEGFMSKVGDILMPSSDVTPDGLAKASAIILDNVVLGGDMNILRPKTKINSIFLSYLLNYSKGEIIRLVSGTTVKHIYPSQIITCQLPVVDSKLEQQKIASCLSSLDELLASHSDKLQALKDHKKGLMQNLFPQLSELGLNGLKDDKISDDANKKILKSSNPQNPNSDNVPNHRFPEFVKDGEWEIRSVENNIKLMSGIALKSSELSGDNSGVPILRGINITEGQIRHTDEMDKFYLGDTSEIAKYLIKENDIVIGMDGSKVGKNVALISKQDTGAILIQRVARIRAKNSVTEYLYQHFLSQGFRNYVDIVNTSSGIPHISVKQIRDYEIGFPPKIQEQQKIASCLSAVDELITAQKEKIEQLQQHKKGLMQGLFPQLSALGFVRLKDDRNEGEKETLKFSHPKNPNSDE